MQKFQGLTTQEATLRLQKYGLNTLPEEKRKALLLFLRKFLTPLAWMLEIII